MKNNIFTKSENTKIISDPNRIKKIYSIMQPLIFIVMYLLYFASYLGRKSLSIGFNGSSGARVALELPSSTYAILGMIYYAAYMCGKFLGGILADKSNIRIALPLSIFTSSAFGTGIAIAGYLNKASLLTSPESISMFIYVTWGIASFIQSLTFPMCAKALVYWYSNKNRAYIWAYFSTSGEIGSACSLILSGFLLQYYSWEAVFIIPALLGGLTSILGLLILRDKPSSIGLPDVETYVGNKAIENMNTAINAKENYDSRSYWQIFMSDIIRNRVLWTLSLTYICVYILRAGTVDWIPKMFMESGNSSPLLASLPAVILSISGILGSLSISFVSEKIFKGKRAPAIVCYFLTTILCLIVFRLIFPFEGKAVIDVPEPFYTILIFILMVLSGIGIYGPQMMVGGIAAIETGSKKVSSTISGITGSVGYLGSIISSFFGVFSDKWGYVFLNNIWIASGVIGILLMLSIWSINPCKDYSR